MDDLYTECVMCCTGDECPLCEGKGFIKAGLTTKQVDMLKEGSDRAKHIDRYFEGDKAAMEKFIDWLRKNPYPET